MRLSEEEPGGIEDETATDTADLVTYGVNEGDDAYDDRNEDEFADLWGAHDYSAGDGPYVELSTAHLDNETHEEA